MIRSNRLGPEAYFPFHLESLQFFIEKAKGNLSNNKISPFCLGSLNTSWQDLNKSTSQPRRELCMLLRNPLKSIFLFTLNWPLGGKVEVGLPLQLFPT